MTESSLTVKGQTTLPKAVRHALSLQPGDRVRYIILEDGQVRLMRMIPAASLAGILRRPGQRPVSLQEMERAVGEGATGA